MVLPEPALKEGTIHDQLGRGVEVLHSRRNALECVVDYLTVGDSRATTNDGGLFLVELA